jgi:hypothetical protein
MSIGQVSLIALLGLGLLAIMSGMPLLSSGIGNDAFARNERYGASDTTSQAASVSNSCLNPMLDSNTIDNVISVGNCGGTVSQQDESGSASAPITHQTANPILEVQRATTNPPTTSPPTPSDIMACEECHTNNLTPEQIQTLQQNGYAGRSIEEACEVIATLSPSELLDFFNRLETFLQNNGVEEDKAVDVARCLANIFYFLLPPP